MDFWINHFTPLYGSVVYKNKLLDLPQGSIVQKTLQTQDGYCEVIFITRQKTWRGWVWSNHLEELYNEYDLEGVFSVYQQTPYPYDAAQYIIAYGGYLYNLCGEGCVSFIFGKDIISERFLADWKISPVSWFNRLIFGGKSLTTGLSDLENMIATYGAETALLQTRLYDTASKSTLLSPARLKGILDEGFKVIVGCKIKQGRLSGSGIGHWIVVTKIVPDGVDNGWVECYNPYPDRRERYSWKEFVASVGSPPYGLCVKG